jgi:hypothetical protein
MAKKADHHGLMTLEIESNGGVAGCDFNMHQLDAHGNTSEVEDK